jgi:D-xylose transport system permease protein
MNTEVATTGTIKGAYNDYLARIKSGDMGALPGVLGLVVLCGVFGVMSDVFLTPGNFANLLTQAASVTVIAMGLVFVLLLGEIDLSAGYASGVCGAVLVILITNHGAPWWIALIGKHRGWRRYLVSLLVPWYLALVFLHSWLLLAAFLMFQGLLLLLAGEGGTIRIEDPTILAVQNNNLSPTLSWILFLAVSALYVLVGLAKNQFAS